MHFLIKLILMVGLTSSTLVYSNSKFPVQGSMKKRVDFWVKVYTEINSNQAFVHDTDNLDLIYGIVKLPRNRKQKNRFLKKEKKRYRKIIQSIAKKNYVNLNQSEKKVAKVIGEKSYNQLIKLSRNFRFQGGLKDRYLVGLKQSYLYLDYIQKTFKKLGLPKELSYLPHVESSFNYKAYSKVGAAGIWQFMRSTGRLYKLKINYVIDERRDPIKATKAAARLLKDNYRILGTWPLALTAYNHGPQSIKRAIKRVGTKRIDKIVERYQGRRFGFASKNFYATFMATVKISEKPYLYFPQFKKPKVFKYTELDLPKPITIKKLTETLNIKESVIKNYNFDIRKSAYTSPLYLPKGYKIKLPYSFKNKVTGIKNKLALIQFSQEQLYAQKLHIVSRGENLYDISRLYRTNMHRIIQFNNLIDPSRIYPGMKLKIPAKKEKLIASKPKTKTETIIKKAPQKISLNKNPLNHGFTTTSKQIHKTPKKLTAKINLTKYELALKKVGKNTYKLKVENEETLGHYADWTLVSSRKIRAINGLSKRSHIRFGQTLKVIIPEEKLHDFKLERNEYHLSLQEDFFNSFIVTGTEVYKVKRGDTLSAILGKKSIPFWLLRQYQTDENFSDKIYVGQKILIPEVEEINQ